MGRQILSQEGHEVVTVSNGDEALQYLEHNRPDLIMADTRMPGPNGYEVCREVKHSDRFQGVHVVLLAGPLEPFDSEQAKSAGSDAVLHKPLDAYSLIETINNLMGKEDLSTPPEPTVMSNSADETLMAEAAPEKEASGSIGTLVAEDPFEDLVEQALGRVDSLSARETKVRAAVADALDASLPELVDSITKRVMARLSATEP